MSDSRHIGTLIVVILKARNLPNKRHIGKQDPYCQVIFNGEKRRTKAIKRGGQHPEWDEEFRYELFEDLDELPHVPGVDPPPPPPKNAGKGPPKVQGGKFIAISCFAEDPREPDLIGEAKVDLTEVLTKGETDEWFTIMHKDKYCGEVYLELTFWLDEPPPTKKAPPKQMNGQYGGRGTFVPLGESSSSTSSIDLSRYSSLSSRDDIRRENLPPSLRSSNSRLDIYVAPYETTRSHDSSIDGAMNDFAELRVDQGNRRLSMPVTGSYLPRPTSAIGTTPEPSYSSHSLHQSTYSDGGGYPYQPYHHDSAPLPDPYQPPYEQTVTPAPSNFHGQARPRYSMPPTSSGFMPLPQPSGFVPLSSNTPQPSGFLPPPSATPAPGGYAGAIVPSRVPSSSFPNYPPSSVAPSGFVSQGPSPSSSYPGLSPSPSQYYPPPQGPPPPTSSYPPSSSFSSTTPTSSYPPPPPSSSFSSNTSTSSYPPPSSSFTTTPTSSYPPPPPSSSFSSTTPTSSFPQNGPPMSSFPQVPPPPSSAPPNSQPYPHSPSTPLPHHSYSAPPEQPYPNQLTHSPSLDHVPPPPPLTDSPSSGQPGGSRPLPQPGQSPQYPPHARRQSSLPVPPPVQQGYYNGTQNQPSFPAASPYQSIPPPPPLPQQPPPQSSFTNGQGQLALPGPPPPLPTSSSLQPGQHQPPPKRRPSLPAPPVTYQQQQSAFQSLPPPPPPPSLPSHLQYEPHVSTFAPPNQAQAYYPGPPPRPPQFFPPQPNQPTQGGYSPPIPQGAEYNYGA